MTTGAATCLRVPVADDSDVVVARQRLREVCVAVGLSGPDVEGFATALTEIGRNVVVHARRGEIAIFVDDSRPGTRGVAAVVRDSGPGIADVEAALRDGHSTSGGLGIGLPSARRLVDDFEIESSPAGTTVTLRMWSPRRRRR